MFDYRTCRDDSALTHVRLDADANALPLALSLDNNGKLLTFL